jgi:GAF domain-containing protein
MIADPTIPLLQRLFTLMNSSAGRHAIFAGAADSALTMLEADAVAIFEYEDVGASFVLTTARNLSLEAQVQVMQALTRRVRGQPIWLSHPQTIGNWIEQLLAEDGGVAGSLRDLACMITIPLRASKGDLLGVMAVFYRDPLALSGRRQVLASLLAGLVGVSLENAALYEIERQRADFMAEVLRSGEVLQVDQSLDSVIQQIVGIVSGTLGWQTVVVVVYDYELGERHLAGWAAADAVLYERLDRLPRSEPLSVPDSRPWRAAQFKISRSYLVDHLLPGAQEVLAALHADRYLGHLGRNGTSSVSNERQWHASDVLITPLTFKGADLGWMAVCAPRDLRRPTLARIQELEVFADQLAQAVIKRPALQRGRARAPEAGDRAGRHQRRRAGLRPARPAAVFQPGGGEDAGPEDASDRGRGADHRAGRIAAARFPAEEHPGGSERAAHDGAGTARPEPCSVGRGHAADQYRAGDPDA